MQIKTDIAVIGAGPVGLFTVFQAGMLGIKCHVIDTLAEIGGQCVALYPEKPIYDIPAIPKIAGQDLINQLVQQALPFNPTYHLNQQVITLKQVGKDFLIRTSKNVEILAKAIIIAAGSGAFGPNKPPLENIELFENKSIFYSINNREQFRDKNVVIAGGGDSAVDWAINLSEITKQVYLIHRRDKFRASPQSIKELKELATLRKVTMVTGYHLHSLRGENGFLKTLTLKDLDGKQKEIECDILCPFFGLLQSLGPISNWGLDLKAHHIKVNTPHCMTNIENIYAVGDIATYDGKLKLILTGFAEAAHAAHHAYSKVFDGKALHFEYSTTKGVKLSD